DIDFNKAQQGATARSTCGTAAPGEMVKTADNHMATKAMPTLGGAHIQYVTPLQANVVGNTVDMDTQQNQFMDNAMRYKASLTLASSKIKGMLTAIQGQ